MLVDKKRYKRNGNSPKEDYIWFELNKVPYKKEELLNGFSTFTDFMTKWQCDTETMCRIIDELEIRDKDLFDFSLFISKFLVEENAFYSDKCDKSTNYNTKRSWYNVYVTPYQFVSLTLNEIATQLIKERFPELFNGNFLKTEKRFKENINKLPKLTSAKLSDIDSTIISENNLTIQDIIDIYTSSDRNNLTDEVIETPRILIYTDGFIALNLDEKKHYSICFDVEDLYDKNWNAVKTKHIFSIPLYDENGEQIKGKWYKGEQQGAPFFNHPLVKELEKIFNQ